MEHKEMGLFSPCETMDSASMIKCQQALLKDYPSITITSVTTDKEYKGFKILFTDEQNSKVLEKNLLSSVEPICVYPSSSYLMILDVNPKIGFFLKKPLRDEIVKKFGRRVLNIIKTKTDNSPVTENWRIEIDVPEYKKYFEGFSNNNSSEILLSVSLEKKIYEFVLKFWCRECKTWGHFQYECPSRNRANANTIYQLKAEESNSNTGQVEDNLTEHASSLSNRNLERIFKEISSGFSPSGDEIHITYDSMKHDIMSLISPACGSSSNASNQGIVDEAGNFVQVAGPSHEPSPAAPGNAEVTKDLSEMLKECIDKACDYIKILDRETLEAFFIHVKKKFDPRREALHYTTNIEGFKRQLQEILDLYYKMKCKGTRKDYIFIKWLNDVVKKLD